MNSILVLTNKNHFLFVLGSTCKCLIMFLENSREITGRTYLESFANTNTNEIRIVSHFFLVFFAIVFNSNVFSQPWILANLYLALMLQEELKKKCAHNCKLKWPKLFVRFLDDGFGIMEGTKKDVEYWINQFNGLRKTINIDKWKFGNHVEYMDIYIYICVYIYTYSREKSFTPLDFWFFEFPKRNKQVYVYSSKKQSRYSYH